MQTLPGQLKPSIGLRYHHQSAHSLQIELIPGVQLADRLCWSNLYPQSDCLLDCSPDPGIQVQEIGPLRQRQFIGLVQGHSDYTIYALIETRGSCCELE